MSKYSIRSVIDWLRAGYPEGIPDKDHFALLAVLRRRLTNDEIDQVVTLSIESAHEVPDRHVDYDTIRAISAGILNEEPSEDDIARVTERLRTGGWPVAEDNDVPDSDVQDSDSQGRAAQDAG